MNTGKVKDKTVNANQNCANIEEGATLDALLEKHKQAQHSPLPWFTMAQAKPDELHPMVSIWAGSETRESIVCNSCSPADAKLIVASVNHAEALAEALRKLAPYAKQRAEVEPEFTAKYALADYDLARSALANWEGGQQ